MSVGVFIRQRRTELGLSLAGLAQRLQVYGYAVERQTISHWENGRNNPPIESAEFREALSLALSVPQNELIAHMGLVKSDLDHTPEGVLAAALIDRMPPEKRKMAVDVLERILAG